MKDCFDFLLSIKKPAHFWAGSFIDRMISDVIPFKFDKAPL